MKFYVSAISMLLLLSGCTLFNTAPVKYEPRLVNWNKEHKINNEVLESEAHAAYVDLFANDIAYNAYITKSKHYEKGGIVYKPLYYDSNKSEFSLLVVMKKMHPGYDEEHNDWWYGVYDESGSKAYHTGRIASCIACHEQVKADDYMFSKSVMNKIEHNQTIAPILAH